MHRPDATLVQDVLTAYRSYFQVVRARTLATWLELDLSLRQVQVLVLLTHQETAYVGTVASQLGIGRSTASLLVDSLVQHGLVSRSEDPADQRRMLERLTAQGIDRIDALFQGGLGGPYAFLVAMQTTDLHRGLQALTALASAHGRDG